MMLTTPRLTCCLLALALAGCGTTKVVAEREDVSCVVPPWSVAPLEAPAKLAPGATVDDLFSQRDAYDSALAKANKRLADVPKNVYVARPQAKAAEPERPGFWQRLTNIFK